MKKKPFSAKKFKVALITGGPSLERGISLNSARSVLDHLESENLEIVPFYLDQYKKAYKISTKDLYSNNPSDFDFKLVSKKNQLSVDQFVKELKKTDIVFPVMHGTYGEDGGIQAFLEKYNIRFVGSSSSSCKNAFDKYIANETLKKNGFFTLSSALLKIYDKGNSKIINEFFRTHGLKDAIVKPASGGSSIGTFRVKNAKEALDKVNLIFRKRMDTRVVLEPFATGKEFTVIVLQNSLGLPVAIIPSEIEMAYHEGRIFDFRKKYLPTNQVKYHCPPRFPLETIEKIRKEASLVFSLFKMNDFARFDGWVMPDGNVWFSDLNTISGMEQNSFLFQQSSRLGMSHSDLLNYVVRNSSKRQGIDFTELQNKKELKKRKDVSVLFGGATSERQVSLMSGTNVWLKLRKSKKYHPTPYLLDKDGGVWELPYTLILNHTVEEIIENAKNAKYVENKNEKLINEVKLELMLKDSEATEPFFLPKKITMKELMHKSDFIFLGLHGGDGENGNLQKLFKANKIKHNGSEEFTSRICMDKFKTGELIRGLKVKDLSIAPQKVMKIKDIDIKDIKALWNSLKKELSSKTIIIKPKDDGCSTGVAHLYREIDLKNYLTYLVNKKGGIPEGTLYNQESIVEMPEGDIKEILFEKFIDTDFVSVKNHKLKYKRKSGYVEVTMGLLQENKKMHAFNPSITIAEGEVLSLEEKFQGGTGINITPPPKEIVTDKALRNSKILIERLAKEFNLRGYARVDAFMNTKTGALSVIEVNTLPGLTPSTVLYHQALAEKDSIYPRELLERIIENSGY